MQNHKHPKNPTKKTTRAVMVRLSEEVHEALKDAADKENRSVSAQAKTCIQNALRFPTQ